MEHLRKDSHIASTPNGLWTGWQKAYQCEPVRLVMWLTTRAFGERFKEHLKEPSPYITTVITQATPPLKIIS